MKINIRAKNIELNSALKEFIEEKIGSVEKFTGIETNMSSHPPLEAFVEVEKMSHHHRKGPQFRAECNLEVKGKSLRAESIGEDLRTAVVEVKDELQRELKGLKEKTIDLNRRKQRFLKRLSRGIKFWNK